MQRLFVNNSKMKATRIIVHGFVQGVFYRSRCEEKARSLGCRGFVRNLPDGTVEVVATGKKVKELIEWCKKGPDAARVDSIDVKEIETEEEFNEFKRIY